MTTLDKAINKIMADMHDLEDLMPNPHTRHQYIKTIVLLYQQYKHEEQMFYDRNERQRTA